MGENTKDTERQPHDALTPSGTHDLLRRLDGDLPIVEARYGWGTELDFDAIVKERSECAKTIRALVAFARDAAAAEREACAKLCDSAARAGRDEAVAHVCDALARAIRGRAESTEPRESRKNEGPPG